MKILDLENLSTEHNELLNDLSLEIRKSFTDMVGRLYSGKEDKIAWLVNSITTRNFTMSTLFMNCCYLALINQLLDMGQEYDVVMVPTYGFKIVVENYLGSRNYHIAVNCPRRTLWKRFKRFLIPIWRLYCYLSISAFCVYYARKSSNQSTNKYNFTKPITIIYASIIENSIQNGIYLDRYYGKIMDFIPKKELKYIYHLPYIYRITNIREIFERLRQARPRFILKEDFLKWSDYLYAIFAYLRILIINTERVEFLYFNIAPLVKEEHITNFFNPISLTAILYYLFPKRLKERGVSVRLLVEWFENQAIDRGLTKGFHTFYKETPTIGYQGYIVPRQTNVHLYPSEYEIKSSVTPHKIGVMGEALVDAVKEFSPGLQVFVAPAFRFAGVWEERSWQINSNIHTVLFALPIETAEAIYILRMAHWMMEQKQFTGIRFLVKPHPSYGVEEIIARYAESLPKETIFIEANFQDCLDQVDVLVANASSTCMEALARGVPVAIVQRPKGLVQNPIPPSIPQGLWRLCSNAQELVKTILYFINRDNEMIAQDRKFGKAIRANYFCPPTQENVLKFLSYA